MNWHKKNVNAYRCARDAYEVVGDADDEAALYRDQLRPVRAYSARDLRENKRTA